MDDKSNELLQDILNQQKKQTDLLQQNLGRVKFSLRALLILMTVMALGLGYLGFKLNQFKYVIMPVPAGGPNTFTPAYSSPYTAPAPPTPMPAPAYRQTKPADPTPAK